MKKYLRKFKEYMYETYINKLIAIMIIIIGILSTLPEKDGTFLVFALFMGITLFFEKEN